jgi:hypothetical protein
VGVGWLAGVRMPYWPLGWGINRCVEAVIGARFDHTAPLTTLSRRVAWCCCCATRSAAFAG